MRTFLKKLKGYKKRITTPKKDKNFKTPETSFGEFEIYFISGYNVLMNGEQYSGVIFKLQYQADQRDVHLNIMELLDIISILNGRHVGDFEVDNPTLYEYISLTSQQCVNLAELYNSDPKYNGNKVLRSLISEFMKIDIIDQQISFSDQKPIYPYSVEPIEISQKKPIYVQEIFEEFTVPDNMKDYLLKVFISYIKFTFNGYISVLCNQYNQEHVILMNSINEIFENYNITPNMEYLKKLLDTNVILIDEAQKYSSTSFSDDIDEIID